MREGLARLLTICLSDNMEDAMKQRTTRSEAVVWSDDFSNKSLDGWTQCGSFTAEDGTLKAVDSPTCEHGMHLATHPSTVAYGTWSFDAYISSALTPRMVVMFISDFAPTMPPPPDHEIHVYMLELLEHDKTVLNLIKLTGKGENQTPINLDSYRATRDLSGRLHIDITRDSSGRFRVYLNRKMVMDVVDTSITASQNLAFLAPVGTALGHIAVSKTVDVLP